MLSNKSKFSTNSAFPTYLITAELNVVQFLQKFPEPPRIV